MAGLVQEILPVRLIGNSRRNETDVTSTSASVQHRGPQASAAEQTVRGQVPPERRREIGLYLELFGYKPDRTILQVHVAGSFGRRPQSPRETGRREAAASRYGGRTFTVVGSSHDPSMVVNLIPPRRSREANPGYVGYLFAAKDEEGKPPHELLPLDLVPSGMTYPADWKSLFATKGYLIAMHVPTSFAPFKNELLRRLRRVGGAMDAKKRWTFFDELEEYGYQARTISEAR
jgi:hypothetical protein